MNLAQGINNFRVYEGETYFYGMAELALPEVGLQGDDMSGAGIAGAFASKFAGEVEPMTMTINFNCVQKSLVSLVTPGTHTIVAMADQESRDNNSGRKIHEAVKYVIGGEPTKFNVGKLAPASKSDATVEFSVTYFACYIGGKKLIEIDQINFIYIINGVDYLADVRKNIGMS